MKLSVFRHLWGVNQTWEQAFPAIRQTGLYDGIESRLPAKTDVLRLKSLLAEHDLGYIASIYTNGTTVAEHIESFRKQVEDSLDFSSPFLNAHSGKDAWSEAEAKTFYEAVVSIEAEYGVKVAHETHRGRVFYNPWNTERILKSFPELNICCDFSHWVCVCERLIGEMEDILQLCADHALHIHGRVGYEEGPQVPDPRAPEYQRHVQAHEQWWSIIWETQKARGKTMTTFTPEFGPPMYLHTVPFTNVPIANLPEICDWQAERTRTRFAAMTAQTKES